MTSNQEMIASTVKKLSDQELREKLTSLAMDVGPITGTTRSLYERKLVQLLTGSPSEFSDNSPTPAPPKSPSRKPAGKSPPVAEKTYHDSNPAYDDADGLLMGESIHPSLGQPSESSTINLIRARKPVQRTILADPVVARKSVAHQSSPFPAANAQFRKTESDGSLKDHILKFVLFGIVMVVIVFIIINQEPEKAIEHRS